MNNKFVKEIYEWIYSITISLAIALFVHIFIFQPTKVVGQSMEPTLHEADYLVVSKLSHTFKRLPEYGDIVIIDSRVNRDRDWTDDVAEPVNNYLSLFKGQAALSHDVWVKRIIGKPGDIITFQDGKVIRNGQMLNETYTKEDMRFYPDKKIVVPADHVYVLGDNRNNSSDSRFIGSIPLNHVLGTVVYKI